MTQPQITVGILSGKEIEFSFPVKFSSSVGTEISGTQKVIYQDGKIHWQGKEYDELSFIPPQNAHAFFELKDVTIGINFHWERKEVQKFKGELKIIVEGEQLTAINIISIEEYLISVISSEMSATASLELLKAHAVISRSWLLNKCKTESRKQEMKNEKTGKSIQKDSATCSPSFVSDSQFIKWYDHEAHKNFDVCADDHCQRYQGITRASTPQAIEAVTATRGEVLMYAGTICDARFSKCCGGAFEEFQNCWENVKHPYLIRQRDSKTEKQLPDLNIEAEADKWIRTSPVAFCNTQDKKILSQVLNNYDQETTDFYRWKVSYTQKELAELAEYIVEGKDIRSNPDIEKHADWVDSFLPVYKEKGIEITKDNAEDILKEEVGQVFAKVLEDAGVYKCTPQGREAFERFLNTVDFHKE